MLVEQFICREDNFAVLLHDSQTGRTMAIDAPDATKILEFLHQRSWGLDYLLITHHHDDHTNGIHQLKRETQALIIGPAAEADKINGLDRCVQDGERLDFSDHPIEIIATPGHTAGAVSYYLPADRLVFTGDTLFSLGCGRLFECPPDIMLSSLKKLQKLPPETALYCGHEYTTNNGRFALTIDGGNAALKARMRQVCTFVAEKRATLPSTIGDELRTNPFLRYDNAALRSNLGLTASADTDIDDVAVFSLLRQRKDAF